VEGVSKNPNVPKDFATLSDAQQNFCLLLTHSRPVSKISLSEIIWNIKAMCNKVDLQSLLNIHLNSMSGIVWNIDRHATSHLGPERLRRCQTINDVQQNNPLWHHSLQCLKWMTTSGDVQQNDGEIHETKSRHLVRKCSGYCSAI
jgi:hypothetical protein